MPYSNTVPYNPVGRDLNKGSDLKILLRCIETDAPSRYTTALLYSYLEYYANNLLSLCVQSVTVTNVCVVVADVCVANQGSQALQCLLLVPYCADRLGCVQRRLQFYPPAGSRL